MNDINQEILGEVIKITTSRFGVPANKVLSDQRSRKIARVRYTIWFLTIEHSDFDNKKIAESFQKAESTVWYGIKVVRDMISDDAEYHNTINDLRRQLQEFIINRRIDTCAVFDDML